MSAREELHGLAGTERWSDEDCALFDSFLDQFAHELAEQIREHFRAEFSRMTAHMGTAPARHRIMGAGKAADLIDPEVP